MVFIGEIIILPLIIRSSTSSLKLHSFKTNEGMRIPFELPIFTIFVSGIEPDYISTATFNNGNVLISYMSDDSSYDGTFAIYDQDGNQIKAPTVFDSGTIRHSSATALTNV